MDTVVVSAQHDDAVSQEQLKADIRKYVIESVIDPKYLDGRTKFLINPTGRFEVGGPEGDSGLTGRKIIVDTYGGRCAHGGGSFSGKDCTKVDRSGAYMARYICKNVVAAGLADECEIELAYAIGVANPVSVFVNSFGTGGAFPTIGSSRSSAKISIFARTRSSKRWGCAGPYSAKRRRTAISGVKNLPGSVRTGRSLLKNIYK